MIRTLLRNMKTMRYNEIDELLIEIRRLRMVENALLHHSFGIHYQIKTCGKLINSTNDPSVLHDLLNLERFLISVKDTGKLIDYYDCGNFRNHEN